MSNDSPFSDEQAAAAVAAEEAVRARTLRQSGSTTVFVRRQPPPRSLWPLIALSLPVVATLIAVMLVLARSSLSLDPRERRPTPSVVTAHNGTTTPRSGSSAGTPDVVALAPSTTSTASETTETPTTPLATPRSPVITITDAPEPLTAVAPVTKPPTEATAAAAPEVTLSAINDRQLRERVARLDQGIDLLTRDLTAREQAIADTRRKLTFLPNGQPPLGAREQLAEAQRHWEGANTREREKIASEIDGWQAEIRNLERMLTHHEEVADSLRRRLQTAREQRTALSAGN